MKRLLFLFILTGLLTLSLCACGESEQNPQSADSQQTTEVASEQDISPEAPPQPVYELSELEAHYRECGIDFDVFQEKDGVIILTKKTDIPFVSKENIASNETVLYDAMSAYQSSQVTVENAYNCSGSKPPKAVVFQCAFSNWELMSAVSCNGSSVEPVSYLYSDIQPETSKPDPTSQEEINKVVGNAIANINKKSKKAEVTPIQIGEAVPLSCEYGDIKLCVEGAENTDWAYPDNETAGHKVVVLLCTVENISYFDEWNPDFVDSNYFVSVKDSDGYNIETDSSGSIYKIYNEAPSGCMTLREGEKGRFAIPYCVPIDETTLTISLCGEYTLTVNII